MRALVPGAKRRLAVGWLALLAACGTGVEEEECTGDEWVSSELRSGTYVTTIDASTRPEVRALLGEPVGDVRLDVDVDAGTAVLSYTDGTGAAVVHELALSP